MNLPIQTFWLLNSSVARLMAEKDMRSVTVAASVNSTESLTEIREHLTIEMGDVMKIDPIANAVRDENAIERLRALA